MLRIMEALRLQMERADFVEGMLVTQTIGEDWRSHEKTIPGGYAEGTYMISGE